MPIVITAIAVNLLAIVISFESPIFGLTLLPLCIVVWSSNYGVQINTAEKLYREYGSAYGMKKGEWKSLDSLLFLAVLKNREGMKVYSKSHRSTTNIDDSYCVYLLNKTHRKKILVQKFDTKDLAIKEANIFAKKLNKEVVSFNPDRY
jgi:hypothetical protein